MSADAPAVRACHAALWFALLLVSVFPSPAVASGRSVSFNAADGTLLSGMLYEAPNRPAAGIVLVHMLGRSKDEWISLADALQGAGATVLAFDLRGHGSSGGNGALFPPMVTDVRAAVEWLARFPGVRPDAVAVVGASLGANLAAIAAGESTAVRGVALVSPSLDYRGVRIDSGVMKRLGERPIWFGASTEDPYALRTVKELTAGSASPREQHLSAFRGHGTALLAQDQDLARALVDWLRRTLIF